MLWLRYKLPGVVCACLYVWRCVCGCVCLCGRMGNAKCNTAGMHFETVNECSFNIGNTYDLQCALSQLSLDKTFISNHFEKYDTSAPKKLLPARTWHSLSSMSVSGLFLTKTDTFYSSKETTSNKLRVASWFFKSKSCNVMFSPFFLSSSSFPFVKLSVHEVDDNPSGHILVMKGAPERILDRLVDQ